MSDVEGKIIMVKKLPSRYLVAIMTCLKIQITLLVECKTTNES